MSEPLITTKLNRPLVQPAWTPRPRLLARLDTLTRLTVINAPAGYGKTTLLTQWLGSLSQRSQTPPLALAWLSLDEHDNDVLRFLRYLTAAVTAAVSPDTLTSPPFPIASPIDSLSVVAELVNLVQATACDTVLALDDYHLIENEAVHATVAVLLRHAPDNLRLVIASRATPPLPLAQLRSVNQLTELNAVDLRLTQTEINQTLQTLVETIAPPSMLDVIGQRTEGWAAGVQLAALAFRVGADMPGWDAEFDGQHRYVVDYLSAEVLRQQPGEVQDFLRQTSILSRMTASLCDAVLGRDNSAALLEYLEQRQLFVTPLDAHKQWYRYHPLFAEFLRAELQRHSPQRLAWLHHQASLCWEAQGDPIAAIDHALAGGATQRAARLIYHHAPGWLDRGEVSTLLGRLRQFPDAVAQQDDELCIWYGWAWALSGQPATAREWADRATVRLSQHYQRILASPPPHDERTLIDLRTSLGQAAAIRVMVARQQEDQATMLTAAQQALELLPAWNQRLRSTVLFNLGLAELWVGEVLEADTHLAEASRLSEPERFTFLLCASLYQRAVGSEAQGQLHRALRLYEEARWTAQVRNVPPLAQAAEAGLARLYYEWNDLTMAKGLLRATPTVTHPEFIAYWIDAQITQGRLCVAQGEYDDAWERLAVAETLARQAGQRRHLTKARAWVARLQLQAGLVDEAWRWATASEVWPWLDRLAASPATVDPLTEFEFLTLCRCLLAQDDAAHLTASLAALDVIEAKARSQGRLASVIETQVVQALVRRALGQQREALSALEQALDLAAPRQYQRLFLDEGQALTPLLERFPRAHRRHAYANSLLAASVSPPPQPMPGPLIEPLTPQETAILGLLAMGLSNEEIARQRVLSLHTVRWYIKQIYQKLGVHNRTQAAAYAKTLAPTPAFYLPNGG